MLQLWERRCWPQHPPPRMPSRSPRPPWNGLWRGRWASSPSGGDVRAGAGIAPGAGIDGVGVGTARSTASMGARCAIAGGGVALGKAQVAPCARLAAFGDVDADDIGWAAERKQSDLKRVVREVALARQTLARRPSLARDGGPGAREPSRGREFRAYLAAERRYVPKRASGVPTLTGWISSLRCKNIIASDLWFEPGPPRTK